MLGACGRCARILLLRALQLVCWIVEGREPYAYTSEVRILLGKDISKPIWVFRGLIQGLVDSSHCGNLAAGEEGEHAHPDVCGKRFCFASKCLLIFQP